MTKPLIHLYDHMGTAVIIAWQSSVLYSNQAAGSFSTQPELEGVLVPFGNDALLEDQRFVSPEIELMRHFTLGKHCGNGAIHGIDEADADVVDGVLKQYRFSRFLEVDRSRLKDSTEAWVWVTVKTDLGPHGTYLFSGFEPYPRPGVLTWCNSD